MILKNSLAFGTILLANSSLGAISTMNRFDIRQYNVLWHQQCIDSLDSMPLSGRCGAGANVWVQDGSIWIYLARNDAYDEQGRLLKLGCLRITPEFPVLDSEPFEQKLDLAEGTIWIKGSTRQGGNFQSRLWFSKDNLYIEFDSMKPVSLNVDWGTWRNAPRTGIKLDVWGTESVNPDHVEEVENRIAWSHHNAEFPSPLAQAAESQHIPLSAVNDLTRGLVFGGAVVSSTGLRFRTSEPVRWQLWDGKAWMYATSRSNKHTLCAVLRSSVSGNPKKWLKEAENLVKADRLAANRKAEIASWKEYWSRSYIEVNPSANNDDLGWQVGRNYQLFRYMIACNRGGKLPLLFNGGIFTFDNVPGRIKGNNNDELPISPGEPTTPDFRRWIGCRFMSQNQRWSGWPAVVSGDNDILAQSATFYRERERVAAARAAGLGAEGVVYPEPLDIWGLPCVAPTSNSLCGASHLTYHFSMMLEHAWMGLCGFAVNGLPIRDDIGWMLGTVRFYDSYYRAECKRRTGNELDSRGRLVIYPSNGLELAYNATNPIETVAGLRRVTCALLALPKTYLSAKERTYLAEVKKRLPDLPVGTSNGKDIYKFAEKHESEYNKWEYPEMFAAWPYRLAGVTKPETLPRLRNTEDELPQYRLDFISRDFSWMPNAVNAAAMGKSNEAKKRIIHKLANQQAQARFPAFFGPGHDWIPDHNCGGSGMTALQEMLMAADPYGDGHIYLLPAWPKDWDVRFKLHAPHKTVLVCEVRNGKVVFLEVSPASRKKDVVIAPGF